MVMAKKLGKGSTPGCVLSRGDHLPEIARGSAIMNVATSTPDVLRRTTARLIGKALDLAELANDNRHIFGGVMLMCSIELSRSEQYPAFALSSPETPVVPQSLVNS